MSTGLDFALPKAWSWAPLKFTTTFLNRGSAPEYVDEGPIRAVSQAANQLSGLDWTRTRFGAYDGDPRRQKGYLLHGDVLINSTGNGTLGRVGYFTEGPDEIPCVADSHVTVARADRQIADPRFMYYWLGSVPFYDYIYSVLVVGATNQIELNREGLAGAPIALPPLEEQRRIADFLDAETARIDRVIALRTAQLARLGEREGSWRSQLFRRSNSGKWARVKHLLRSKPRYGVLVPEFVEDGIPFIRVNDLSGLTSIDALSMIPRQLSEQYSRTVTEPGDVLLTVVGATIGKVALISADLAGANTARAIAVLRPKLKHSPSLLASWIGTAEFMEQARLATGSDTAQPTLGMEDLANFAIRWPTDDAEQRQMTEAAKEHHLDTVTVRAAFNGQIDLLAERRRALITAAVTGGITV